MSTTTTIRNIEDLDIVVDGDAHVSESTEQLVPYLDEPYSEFFSSGEGEEHEAVTPTLPRDELFRSLGGKVQWQEVPDVQSREAIMDRFHLDYCPLTPTIPLFVNIFSDDRYAHAVAEAENDFFINEFLDEGGEGIKGLISIATQQPDIAAEEIDRCASHDDMIGVYTGSVGINPGLGDRRYDPIWQAMEDHDLPLVLHGGTGPFSHAHHEIKRALKTYWEVHIVSHPFDQMIQLVSMMGQGIPERYDVDIIFQEAGVGWIPYSMYRMDNEYMKRRPEVPLLEKKPSDYITDPDGPFFFTSQPMAEPDNSEHLAQLINMFNGQENLIFSTDYPHYDFDTPDELFNLIKGHFDEQALRNIFGETAARVYGL